MAKEKGATGFVVSTDPESIKAYAGKCNLILNVVPADHNANTYFPLLAKSGTMVQMGLCLKPHEISNPTLMFERKSISGSLIGGIQAT